MQQSGKKDERKDSKKESEESDDEGPSTSFKLRNSSSDSDTESLPRAGKLFIDFLGIYFCFLNKMFVPIV